MLNMRTLTKFLREMGDKNTKLKDKRPAPATPLMAYREIGRNRGGKGKLHVFAQEKRNGWPKELGTSCRLKTRGVCPALGENRGRHKHGSGRVIRLGKFRKQLGGDIGQFSKVRQDMSG